MSCAQTLTRFVWGLYIWKYSRRKRNKALQTKTTGKNRWSRRTGSELHADPPAWIFAVQACNSNYITWKQIQIINTLVAKFRKAHDATPQHDTSKTPKQASPNPSNFGDTWKYLCSSAASSWSLEGSMCQLMDTPSWSSLWQGICFRAKLPESCL